MPRDLADVLHYFLPELSPEASPDAISSSLDDLALPGSPLVSTEPATARLPIVALPIGEHDVVRAAFAWNLTVEVVRLGARATLLTPDTNETSALWPMSGAGPLGAELVRVPADDLGGLYRSAVDLAMTRAADAHEGGLIIVHVPPPWLRAPGDGRALLRWMLLFTACDSSDVEETYGLAKMLVAANPEAEIGITIHGAKCRPEAETSFGILAKAVRQNLARDVKSYGLLVDDLHVYRAIVAQRPIGLAHPQSPAALGLRDVAGLLLDDARKRSCA